MEQIQRKLIIMVNKFKHKLKRRENGIGRIPIAPEQIEKGYCLGSELRFILQQEYPEIYCHFEQYSGLDITDSNKYGFLKEVVYNNKVVGFAIYQRKEAKEDENAPNLITLVLIYILPDFRGKGIMHDEIKDTMSLHPNWAFSIDCPNYHIVKSLIKNGYGMMLNEDIAFMGGCPISAQVNGNTYIYPLYDLRIKKGINLDLPSLTPSLDRDVIDGFTNFSDEWNFFEQYDSPQDYFEEVANVVREYNSMNDGDDHD